MSSEMYEETLYGQILPIDWNNESVSSIMILVDGEEEFIVEPDKNGMELVNHLESWVRAEVFVKEDDDELRVKIREFTVEDDMDYVDDDKW